MILIQNIYHMLAYAFHVLNEQGLKQVDAEVFDNAQRLCAEILIKGVSAQIKRGLKRDYVPYNETLSSIKGRIDVSASIKNLSVIRRQLVCSYDKFTTDIILNRIIKSTLILLLKSELTGKQKKEIKKLLIYFADVEEIDVRSIDWNIHYSRTDQTYQFLITICQLTVKGLLQTQSDGSYKLMNFFDEQRMSRLYEKFILEYYKKHFNGSTFGSSLIDWQLDYGTRDMLPAMKTDIMLQKDNNILIIDAKYYGSTTQVNFDKHTIHSSNLYQIFTYVKNKEFELRNKEHKVSGMLLYAKTDEEIQPDNEYYMSGNKISVKTLDLNTDFTSIKNQLDNIVNKHFAVL